MKSLLSALLVFVLVGCSALAPVQESNDLAWQSMRTVTVAIEGCSAVVVAPEHLLTAAHCDTGKYDVLKKDESKDLMLIRIKGLELPVYARIAESRPEVDDLVFLVGYPLARGIQFKTFGTVQDPDFMLEDGTRYIVHTAPSIFGNSGGPLFNAKGELVGIASKLAIYGLGVAVPHFSLAVGLDEIKAFIIADDKKGS